MIHPNLLNEIKKKIEEAAKVALGESLKSPIRFIKANSSTITLQRLEPSGYNVGISMTLFVPGVIDEEDTPAPASDA